MSFPILQKKHALRKVMREQRSNLGTDEVYTASQKIIQTLITHPLLNQSHKIASYFASHNEVDLMPWCWHVWNQGKKCYLPVVSNQELYFYAYDTHTIFKKNKWGIQEPCSKTSSYLESNQLDVVLIPFLAFDQQGFRLGQGKGYYDRSFAFLLQNTISVQKKPYLIGIGYEFQKVSVLEHDVWDIPLQEIITETTHYRY